MLPRDGKGMLMIIFGGFGGLIGLMMGTHYVCTNDHGQNRYVCLNKTGEYPNAC